MSNIKNLRESVRSTVAAALPSATAWRGATIAIYVFTASVTAVYFAAYFLQDFTLEKLPAFIVTVGEIILIGIAALLILKIISRLPRDFRFAAIVVMPFAVLSLVMGDDITQVLFGAALLLIVCCIGAGIAVLREQGWRPTVQKVTLTILGVGVLGMLAGLYAIFGQKSVANPQLADFVLQDYTLNVPNPGLPGAYAVQQISYGSGKDLHRSEFGEAAELIARSVDGTKLIDNWDGLSGWLRTRYWGFDASQLPLQARVWYPAGDGPFPLVLIVHGNHSMEDFSDPGYAYLGEHLASRGTILASVDENFLNSSRSAAVNAYDERPGLKQENDARGWMLLQHLAQWRDWNVEAGHPFFGKVDIDRVALIGHSRGGEAVGIAAAFNSLDRYPDDATLEFDFDFNLRGVIAIAPVYGQYKPRDRYTPVTDVNYFTIHGDMDGDVQSFEGMAQYSRVAFTNDEFRFRAGLYVVGANHGQFNTTWGNRDTSWYRAWALDLNGIMDGEAQRDVARSYFSGFLEVVLHDNFDYLPMFRDARYAANWLPQTFYINQFATSGQRPIADFEEDIDPGTTTIGGGTIAGAGLSKWYEIANELKGDELDTHAAVFAWDREFSSEPARVDFVFPEGVLQPSRDDVLVLSLSGLDIATLPDDWEPQSKASDSGTEGQDVGPLDWSIVIVDAAGQSAVLPLSHDSLLYPQINAHPRRARFLDAAESKEVLFRRFEFKLSDFATENSAIDVTALTQVGFVFDVATKGAIIMDDMMLSGLN